MKNQHLKPKKISEYLSGVKVNEESFELYLESVVKWRVSEKKLDNWKNIWKHRTKHRLQVCGDI